MRYKVRVRCALVALELGVRFAGIDKAMMGQARAAAEIGAPFDVIVVNPDRTGVEGGVRYLRYAPVPRALTRISRLTKARLLASVPELGAYDVVFLRYPTAVDLDPLRFIRRTKARVATVHHAKELVEQLSAGRSPGILARAALEYVQGRRVLRSVDGIVGVTDEIRDYQLARAGHRVPGRTVANGVDVKTIAETGFVPYDGRELRLAFMASSHAVWHGTDRLLGMLRAHRGPRRIVVDMIGKGSGPPGTEEPIGEAAVLRHHGMLSGAALDEVLRGATLGISTLAFFRTGLRQAAVLKTREYIARGLPTVLGYEDVDLPADCPFVLRVPNDDSPLSTDALFEFAERLSRERELVRTMRSFAEQTLDWRVKVPRFVAFADELLASPRHVNS